MAQTFDREGFFIAKFKKHTSCNNPNNTVKKGAFPFNEFDKNKVPCLCNHLKSTLG